MGSRRLISLWICFVCFLVMFLDGFDGTVLGVATPKIAEYLHTNMAAMGVAGSAGSIGPFLGAVLLGMAADRWGRKWMLFSCCLVFGIFSFLTIYVTSVEQLTILRFIAGIGMGGAIPNALAFGSEYAPSRSRRTFVASMYAGVPMGATVGGLVSAWLIPHFGWQSLFLYGGIVPVFIALAVAIILPESLEFLAGKGGKEDRMRKILARTSPEIAADKDCKIVPTNVKLPGVPFTHLFKEGRASVTLLFWITLMGGFYSMVVLIAWTPTLLHKSGASVVQYSLAFAALNFGAVVASIAIGRLMDKGNPFRLLKVGFVLSFVSLVVFGIYAGGGLLTVIATSIICGDLCERQLHGPPHYHHRHLSPRYKGHRDRLGVRRGEDRRRTGSDYRRHPPPQRLERHPYLHHECLRGVVRGLHAPAPPVAYQGCRGGGNKVGLQLC